MNIKRVSFFMLSLLSASDIYAITPPKYSQGQWLISGDVGAIWPNVNTTINVDNGSRFPASGNVDQYLAYSNHEEVMLAAAGGYRWTQDVQPWLPAVELALRYQYLFPQTITGSVTQYSLPDYTDYAYRWRTSADVLSLYTKLDLLNYKQAMVYFDLGLGAAFVNAHSYQETAYPGVIPRTSPAYTNNTSTQFSYNVGAGIDLPVFPQLIVSAGYDYQAIGGIVSGAGQGTWSGTQLNIGTYGINTATISVTYLFDNPFVTHAVDK